MFLFTPSFAGWNQALKTFCCSNFIAILTQFPAVETCFLNGLRSNCRCPNKDTSVSTIELLGEEQRSSGHSAALTTKYGTYLSLLLFSRRSAVSLSGTFGGCWVGDESGVFNLSLISIFRATIRSLEAKYPLMQRIPFLWLIYSFYCWNFVAIQVVFWAELMYPIMQLMLSHFEHNTRTDG